MLGTHALRRARVLCRVVLGPSAVLQLVAVLWFMAAAHYTRNAIAITCQSIHATYGVV